MKKLLIFILATSLHAATITVTAPVVTQTSIGISYVATTTAFCTITATDNNNGPAVADLDTSKFTNANQDLSRTVANGFKFPTLCGGAACGNNVNRTVFIGGHDEIKLGTDGKYYSTALQVNSSHTINVSCNGGADTGSITTSTRNIPLASNYPEMTIPTPGSPLGGIPQPTIDWSRAGRTKQYIDPVSGVLIQRVTGGSDHFDDTNPLAATLQTPAIDVNGGAWTTPNNFITNQVAGTLATTSTVNAPIFAAFDPAFAPPGGMAISDFLVTPYGNASSNSIVSTWCISFDSGQTCANVTPLDVTFSTVAQCQSNADCLHPIPSATPSSFYDAWGGIKGNWPSGVEDITNKTFTNVSASGSTVTLNLPDDSRGSRHFYLGLAVGSKFMMTACGVGTRSTPLTVAAVNNQATITTVESGLALTTCTYTDMHVGIRAVLKNAGTLNVSFQAKGWASRYFNGGTSAAHYYCAKQKVTDITTNCDGVVQAAASGYLCQLPSSGPTSVFLVQDDGRMCLQSNLYGTPINHGTVPFPGWIDNKSLLALDYAVPPHLWKASHIANNYQEMPVDPTHTLETKMTYTDLGPAVPSSAQIIAIGGPVATAVSSGIWNPFSFEFVTEDSFGNQIIQYNSQQTQNGLCSKCYTDINGTVLSVMSGIGGYPMGYTACHSAPTGGGGYVVVGTQGDDSSLAPYKFNTAAVPFGGPFVSNVIGVRKNGSWVNTSITISSCTKAATAVCTSTGNNLDDVQRLIGNTAGALITCSGATGTGWVTNLNAAFYAHKIDNNTFSLYTDPRGATPLNSTGYGTLGGTITCALSRPIYSLKIASVSGSTTARVTINLADVGPAAYYPTFGALGIANIMFDADPITIVQTVLNSTTQYYAKVACAGCSNAQFDVYSDPDLAPGHAVSVGSLGSVNNFYVVYAERCPDPATITLPGPMYADTTFGSVGNPKVRCVGIRHSSEMESNWPGTGEHAAYPPPATSTEFGNANKSMLHQIAVGDGMMDLSHVDQNHEIFYTISVDRSVSENQIDVIYVRNFGDDPNFLWRGSQHGPSTDTYSLQHVPGWTSTGTGIVGQIMLDPTTNPPTYFVPAFNGAHSDIVTGSTPGLITSASGYLPGTPDDQIDVPISTYINSFASTHTSLMLFGSGPSFSWIMEQSYPGKRNIFSQTAATERVWKSDWDAPNVPSGNAGQNGLDGAAIRTITNTSGIVWKIQPLSPINIKVAPIFAAAIPYNYFTDKSGPASTIGSGDNGKFCHAYNAGECVGGSSAGDVYIAATSLQTVGANTTYCYSNDATIGSPCVFGVSPGMGWAIQVRQTPIDTTNKGTRRLTQGFWPGLGQYYASNWASSPDAKWGFFAGTPLGQRPRSGEAGSHFFAMKLPPWPTTSDGVNRTQYVQIPIALSGVSGDNIRIAFGYGENGDPSTFRCTTRNEACWTANTPTSTNPFVFAGDAQDKTPCGSGCTVNVPAIPGRIVWYQVERTNGASTVLGPILVSDTGGDPAPSITGGPVIPGKMVIGGKMVVH